MSLSHDQRRLPLGFSLLREVDATRDKAIAGWLRILFFAAILFSHTVQVPFEFPEGRHAVAWTLLLRDFGAAGFFLLAGASLQAKRREHEPVALPSNLLKLVVAAAALAAFDIAFTIAKGGAPRPFTEHFYSALYDTNLWFFVAYAFAGPLLLSLDRRGVWLTATCSLLLVAFPASYPLLSPYILQTISLAFVWMAIGAALYGYRGRIDVALALAAGTLAARILIDDGGPPGGAVYPALDVVLRIVYGVACFLVLKSLTDVIVRRSPSPGWANNLFIPYIIQFPLILLVKVALTALFIGSLDVRMPPIFQSLAGTLSFMTSVFVATLVASFVLAFFLRRYDVRV